MHKYPQSNNNKSVNSCQVYSGGKFSNEHSAGIMKINLTANICVKHHIGCAMKSKK